MAYGTVVLTLDNVLLPKEKLHPTPSFHDGLDEETEKDLRITGCELIQTSGILLKLPQTAMATGQVLFQRFYFSKSFVRQPMETTAMACVYLASKIEEAPRRIRDVINVFHHIRQYRDKKPIQPLILDPSYIRLKSDVTLAERRILKELGFCVHVKHPHKLIVIYMQQLGYGHEKEFMQRAWNYMNDALRTPVFVVHTPEAIACACIFLSGRILNITLPNSWFQIFEIQQTELIEIATQILELYERPKINVDELESKVETLTKAYQESRMKNRSGGSGSGSGLDNTKPSDDSTTTTAAPVPSASNNNKLVGVSCGKPENVQPSIIISNVTNKEKKDVQPQLIDEKTSMNQKNIMKMGIDGGGSELNGSIMKSKETNASTTTTTSSSEYKRRGRKSPSPIIYNSHESPTSYRHQGRDSRDRHKHKKRKKSSASSRSRSRDRKLSKKSRRGERERTPEESMGRHHKRKYYHRR